MKKKAIYVVVALMMLVLTLGIETGYASRRGGHFRDGGHSRQFSSFHGRGFGHRKFVHRPGVVIRYYSPYYFYPHRLYQRSYRHETYKRPVYSYNANSLSLTAIVDMSVRGVADEVIIDEIRRTRSIFKLNAEVIDYLKANHVSDRIIDYMLANSRY